MNSFVQGVIVMRVSLLFMHVSVRNLQLLPVFNHIELLICNQVHDQSSTIGLCDYITRILFPTIFFNNDIRTLNRS